MNHISCLISQYFFVEHFVVLTDKGVSPPEVPRYDDLVRKAGGSSVSCAGHRLREFSEFLKYA
jgi:hypothetical protein